MSAHKHTPGPWAVRYDYVVQAPAYEGGRLVPVAQPYGVNCDGTDLFANARLIAAAPDLLEALEPFAHATLTHSGQVIGLTREDFERALAAIAKATGEPA